MGRRKLPVKLIEDKNSRRVTFSKRRKGLIKKAREISVLCDVDVAVIVFSGGDRLYEYCSSDSLPRIIQQYHSSSRTDPTVSRDGSKEESTNAGFVTSSELLQTVERVKEAHLDQVSVADLLQVEEQIADTLKHIRSRKTQLMMEPVHALQKEKTVLEEENKALTSELEALKNDENGQNNTGENHGSQPLLLKFL